MMSTQQTMNQQTQFVTLADTRQLAYAEYGQPEGIPTIYLHGFPGSRLEASLFDLAARNYNLRVLAPDRSGIGFSDPDPERRIIDWPSDVTAFADALEIDKFLLIGVSGGAPYALACAHQSASRIAGLTLVCPLGPLFHTTLMNSMHWPAKLNFRSVTILPGLTRLIYHLLITPLVQRQPNAIYQMMLAMAPEVDTQVLNRPLVRSILTRSIQESIRQGSDAILHEMQLYTLPWEFKISKISVPIHLWHGTADEIVPIVHGRLLSDLLTNCTAHYIEDEGHFSLPIDHMEKILEQCIQSMKT
jgi:pimeloyl-ACP methyl ester carboxylesterase